MQINFLIVEIIEYICDDFPGFVHCKFNDAFGKEWHIYEKVPIISTENILKNTILPKTGYLAGKIINEENDIVYFSTEHPYNIEAGDGENNFYVFKNQIAETLPLTEL